MIKLKTLMIAEFYLIVKMYLNGVIRLKEANL